MIICICRRVSDRDIVQAVREGCESFDELQFETGVATACGSCHDCAKERFEACCDADSATGGVPIAVPVTMQRRLVRAASSAPASASA